jgi:hypothetical protein
MHISQGDPGSQQPSISLHRLENYGEFYRRVRLRPAAAIHKLCPDRVSFSFHPKAWHETADTGIATASIL